jgi:hydroxymethylpyrimidine/phosphomethylpyrimidine kinase
MGEMVAEPGRDPVLVSSTGDQLFDGAARQAYLDEVFPHATVVTPNTREATHLLRQGASTVDDAIAASDELGRTGT